MRKVAVVAHARKTFGGGLPELRELLAAEGCRDLLWYEVRKSRKAPKYARRALDSGAEVLFVWGGDGTVQRCIDAVAETKAAQTKAAQTKAAQTKAVVAILPAGTANLLATNLGVPDDLPSAVRAGLYGEQRLLDTGTVNGEHFAVMAGAGFDARMITEADRGMKDRIGRAAYLYTGARNLGAGRVKATVKVDGQRFFKGLVSCVLVGNVGKVLGGVEAFRGAQPDDGLLDIGVVTAKNPVEWARTLGRVALGKTEKSPFVEVTRGKKITVRFSRPLPYELDGGGRPAVGKLRIKVRPGSIRICVPGAE